MSKPTLNADLDREDQDFDWRLIFKRHALRTSTCDVCHQHVDSFTMWQEPTPGAEDGLLYGHRACVQFDGEVRADG